MQLRIDLKTQRRRGAEVAEEDRGPIQCDTSATFASLRRCVFKILRTASTATFRPGSARVFFPLVFFALLVGCSKPEPLPKFWSIPDFKLTERSGEPFESASLKGKVWVADFFFAKCPGVCPMLSARMSALHQQFAGEEGVRFVSITTYPSQDTPAVLRDYAARFKADARWLFLTGDTAYIWNLCQTGFKLSVVESPKGAEIITHSSRLVLVDKTGTVRGTYEGVGEEGPKRIIEDIRRLLIE